MIIIFIIVSIVLLEKCFVKNKIFNALASFECSRSSLRVNAEVYCWAILPSVAYVNIEHGH